MCTLHNYAALMYCILTWSERVPTATTKSGETDQIPLQFDHGTCSTQSESGRPWGRSLWIRWGTRQISSRAGAVQVPLCSGQSPPSTRQKLDFPAADAPVTCQIAHVGLTMRFAYHLRSLVSRALRTRAKKCTIRTSSGVSGVTRMVSACATFVPFGVTMSTPLSSITAPLSRSTAAVPPACKNSIEIVKLTLIIFLPEFISFLSAGSEMSPNRLSNSQTTTKIFVNGVLGDRKEQPELWTDLHVGLEVGHHLLQLADPRDLAGQRGPAAKTQSIN